MSLTSQIASSDVSFKLSQKLVASLAEKYGFKFEDGWAVISSRSVDNVQKRLKRQKRKNNPVTQVKHPRTAFSFFTQKQRPIETGKHPKASFGELSRFVSEAWKALSAAELQKYKEMEVIDKSRYQTERAAVLAAQPTASTTEAEPVAAPVAEVKVAKTPKATKAATPEAVTTPTAPAKAAKAPKVAKAADTPVVDIPAHVSATPTPLSVAVEAKPATAAKAPRAAKVASTVAAPASADPAVAPKAAKAPKAVKA